MSTGLQYCRQALLFSLVVFSLVIPASSQTIIYVDADAIGSNDGSSWEDAFVYLQDALAVAEAGDEVWVAEGVYLPDHGANQQIGDRDAFFDVAMNLALIGGFDGTETSPEQRDWEANRTVLSGDLLENDNDNVAQDEPTRQDNSRTVLRAADAHVVLDGLEIRSAHGMHGLRGRGPGEYRNLLIAKNYSDWGGLGAGLNLSSDDCPAGSNIVFADNISISHGGGAAIACTNGGTFRSLGFYRNRGILGGGLYTSPDSRATLIDATFVDNDADAGAAIYNKDDLLLINGVILGNGNDLTYGGGIQIEAADPPYGTLTVVNSVIAHNRGVQGGGIYALGSPVYLINSVVAFNTATNDGGGFHHRSTADTLAITNSIVWGNTADSSGAQLSYVAPGENGGPVILTSSVFQGPLPDIVDDDGLTILEDPLFVDPAGPDGHTGTIDDDFSLMMNSPAVDAGTNAALPPDSLDLDGDLETAEALPIDLLHNHRVHDAGGGLRVDIGPHEYDASPVSVRSGESRSNSLEQAELYPNPTRGDLTIVLPNETGPVDIHVYDAVGRLIVLPESVYRPDPAHRIELDTAVLAAGLYLVVIRTGETVISSPLLIVK